MAGLIFLTCAARPAPPRVSPRSTPDPRRPCDAGGLIRVNQTFLQWTGYERAPLLAGRRWQELLTVPGRIFYETHFAPLLRMQGVVNEIAYDFLRPGCAPLPVLMNAVQVLDAAGQPLLLRFTVFDATDRRRYERELLEARRRTEH